MRHATDSGRMLIAPVRRRRILDMLQSRDYLTNAEICAATNASIATVRRDLALLERLGHVTRVHGGVTRITPYPRTESTPRSTRAVLHDVAQALDILRSGDILGAERLLRRALESAQQHNRPIGSPSEPSRS